MSTPSTQAARRRLVLLAVTAVIAFNAVPLVLILRDDDRGTLAWIGLTVMLLGLAGVVALGLAVVLHGRRR